MEQNKRVIELGIIPEDEISGCSAIALVEEPAIELDFRYFNKETFVYPSGGESEDEFISRCIPVVLGEGKEEDQAAAICYSYWDEKMAEVGPRGGIKESPKAPKGDTPNRDPKGEGSAKGKATNTRSAKVSAEDEKSLQKKADEFNERYKEKLGYGVTVGMLKTVYQRGLGAYNSSHSPEVNSAKQWGMARVNSFLYVVKNGRPENPKYKQDNDLLPGKHPKAFAIVGNNVVCDDCGWTWAIADGGEDVYICHKCGCDNNPNIERFESYNDYPKSATNAAKRALEFRDKNPDIDCGTAVGWTRANQLAKGENISEETIARMASFARHLQYKDVPYTEGCGGLMVDAWGGQAGIEWASNKLKEIRGEDFEIDTTGLTPYEDPGIKPKRIEDIYSQEVIDTIIAMAAEMGYTEDEVDIVEKFTFTDDKNPKDADYTPARTITKADGVEYLYKYNGRVSSNSRSFCRRMMGLKRFYSREEIDALDTFNEEFGPGVGGGKYSIFKYKGGSNCGHSFQKYEVQRIGKRLQAIPIAPTDPIEVQAATAPRNQQGNGYVKRPQRNAAPLGGGTDSFSKMLFADEEKKIVVGPCMVPDIEIYRRDEDGDPYYVKFSEQTIREIAMKYMKQARTNDINQDHIEDKDAGTYIFESWIVEDPETDKAKTVYGYNVPKGTWMCAMKVEDPAVWKRIKEGSLQGFSVEGSFADMEELEARRNYEKIKSILKG